MGLRVHGMNSGKQARKDYYAYGTKKIMASMWGLLCGTWYYDASRCVYRGIFPLFFSFFNKSAVTYASIYSRGKQLLLHTFIILDEGMETRNELRLFIQRRAMSFQIWEGF